MTGKDWFIVGIRLLGTYILYFGFQETLLYPLSRMFFDNLEKPYYQQPLGWPRLFYGGVNIAIGVLTLTKAGRFADWCYAKDRQATQYGYGDRGTGESEQALPAKLNNNNTVKLTEEQKDLLIRMGKADDENPPDLPADADRIIQELIELGLVYDSGEDSVDLTDEGERVYEGLTGEDVN